MINRLKTSQSRNFLLIPGNTPQILPAKDNNSQNQEEPQNDKNTWNPRNTPEWPAVTGDKGE